MLVGSGAAFVTGAAEDVDAAVTEAGTTGAGTFEVGPVEAGVFEVEAGAFEVEGVETGFDFVVEAFFAGAFLSFLSDFLDAETSFVAGFGWLAALDDSGEAGAGPETGTVGVVLTGASLVAACASPASSNFVTDAVESATGFSASFFSGGLAVCVPVAGSDCS
jgi:hypothetical protein